MRRVPRRASSSALACLAHGTVPGCARFPDNHIFSKRCSVRALLAAAAFFIGTTAAFAQTVTPGTTPADSAVTGAASGGIQGAAHPGRNANPVTSGAAGATNGAATGALQGAVGGAIV